MKKIKCIIFVIVFLSTILSLNAQEDDKNIINAQFETENLQPSDKQEPSCSDICLTFSCAFWLYTSVMISYLDYPYEKDAKYNFIVPPQVDKLKKDVPDTTIVSYEKVQFDKENENDVFPQGYSASFYSLEAGVMHDFGASHSVYYSSFRGRFWRFFGPQIDFRYDKNQDGDKGLNTVAFGLNLPLFQFDILTPELYFQITESGKDFDYLGTAWGLYVSSYPIKPLIFTYKYGREYCDDYKIHEYSFTIGVILYRFEVYAGYSVLSLPGDNFNSFKFGSRIWF